MLEELLFADSESSHVAFLDEPRDVELKRERANASQIVTVGPTGFASSYFLAQHPLSLVEFSTLPPTQRDELSAGTGLDLDEFEFIQIGRSRTRPQNHSLSEY